MSMEQVIIIGAGPCGLSAAVELQQVGIQPLVIDKGCVVNSIYNYPTYMIFHSTAELLEIGGVPFPSANEKPTRIEALNYYRLVAERNQVRIHSYETVTEIKRTESHFTVVTENRFKRKQQYETQNVIIATGYFDHPNKLNVPGEDLPKVFSFYKEAHPFTGMKVAIVGANNSAVDAAIDLQRAGAEVTVICRGPELSDRVKAWTKPIFLSLAEKGHIRVYYSSTVEEIGDDHIIVNTPEERLVLDNDFVFTLIGFRPDRTLLSSLGVKTDPETGIPHFNEETMETNVPNVFLAGVVAAGYQHANAIFIENGRFHGRLIAKYLAAQKLAEK